MVTKQLCSFFLTRAGRAITVKKIRNSDEYYVIASTLFAKDAVKCSNANKVFELIEKIAEQKENIELDEGYEIVEAHGL